LSCYPSLSVFAAASELPDEEKESFEDALSFNCTYDAESSKVSINGTMRYEAFAEHKKSKLLIYAVPPGASEYDVAKKQKPVAEAAASIRFDFTFSNEGFLDRYSKYAIFLRSPDGELTLGTEAQYPEVEAKVERERSKTYFKGIRGASCSYYSDIDAGTVILPVYLDDLFTNVSGGYVYHLDNSQLFFSRSYIDKLDAAINSYSVSGAKVYLQYLQKNGDSFAARATDDAEYYLPNVYDEEILMLIHSLTVFLTSRYSSARGGRIDGIVLGKAWDDCARNNSADVDGIDAYVQRCADYAIVVANAARSVDPSMDIVLPFGDENFGVSSDVEEISPKCFSVNALIEKLVNYFDNCLGTGMECSFLLEGEESSLGITNESIRDGIDYSAYAGKQSAFSDFLDGICDRYTSGSKYYIFKWNAPAELYGNALACAYTFLYYKLYQEDGVFSFVADLSGSENERINDVYRIAKYIDTPEGAIVTKNVLSFFNENSWDDVVKNAFKSDGQIKTVYTQAPVLALPDNITGSFKYFEFSSIYSTDGWYRGIGAQSLNIAYATSDRKALCAQMNTGLSGKSEIIYDYENYERLSYTPYLKFELQINGGAEDSLYEVSVLCENSLSRLETFCTVKGNEVTELVLDLSDVRYVGSFDNIENLKISVRPLSEKTDSCTLWLYGISGHSTLYSDKELGALIEKEREKINSAAAEDDTVDKGDVIIAFAIVLLSGLAIIAIFAVTGKKDGRNE
jgi:hypothetical protein